MNWRGVGSSKIHSLRGQGKGLCFLMPHLLTSHHYHHPRNVFPAYYPPTFAISANTSVSVASRGHTTLPDGNAPRLGTCLLEQTKELPEGRESL